MCTSTLAQPDNCGCTIFKDLWRWIIGIFASINYGIDGLANCTEYLFQWVYDHLKGLSTSISHALVQFATVHPYLAFAFLALIASGPIIVLVLIVIFEQAVLYIAFFFGTLTHGFLGDSPSRWYWTINGQRHPPRDRFFLRVQSYSERYNNRSVDSHGIMSIRVAAGILAGYFFVVIWQRWL